MFLSAPIAVASAWQECFTNNNQQIIYIQSGIAGIRRQYWWYLLSLSFVFFFFCFFPPCSFVCCFLMLLKHMLLLHAISVIWFALSSFSSHFFHFTFVVGIVYPFLFLVHSSIRSFHSPSFAHFSYHPSSWIFIASTMFPNPNLDKTFQLMAIYIVFFLFFWKLWISIVLFFNWYPWKIYVFFSYTYKQL